MKLLDIMSKNILDMTYTNEILRVSKRGGGWERNQGLAPKYSCIGEV